jgi:hypothetical protein
MFRQISDLSGQRSRRCEAGARSRRRAAFLDRRCLNSVAIPSLKGMRPTLQSPYSPSGNPYPLPVYPGVPDWPAATLIVSRYRKARQGLPSLDRDQARQGKPARNERLGRPSVGPRP